MMVQHLDSEHIILVDTSHKGKKDMKNTVLTTAITVFVVSCGGSSTPSDTNGGSTAYNACESSYYQTVTGTWFGTVNYRYDFEGVQQANCDFDVVIEIAGSPLVDQEGRAEQCQLSSSYTSTAFQFIYQPFTAVNAEECISTQGSLITNDPNSNVINPEVFYENIQFPVTMGVIGPEPEASGPYQGNTDQIVRYTPLIGGPNGLADAIRISETGDLEIIERNPNANQGQVVFSDLTRR